VQILCAKSAVTVGVAANAALRGRG